MRWLFLLCFVLLGCSAAKENFTHKQQPPNIVLFIVDDMGWQDTSVPFAKEKTSLNNTYHTPNMERLANQGVKFTQAYATPICSPSRISLLTGSNMARHRVTNWTLEYNKSTDAKDEDLQFPNWNINGFATEPNIPNTFYATSLPEILQQANYHTIHVGKAHFASMGTPGADPLNIGFDVNIAGHAAGGLQSYEGESNFGNIPYKSSYFAVPGLQEFYGKDIFITEALTQKALKALDKRPKDKPFFLHLSHYAVHVPIMGDKRFLQKYLDKKMHLTEAQYATLIEGVDKSLGDLMNYLEKNKLDKNTIIIFLSDNGGLDILARGLPPNSCNAPLSSGKGTLREGGIRIPLIISSQNGEIRIKTSHENVIIEDLFPTILEIAKIYDYKTIQKIDGKSLLPILSEKEPKTLSNKPLFWHLPNKWFDTNMELSIAPSSAVREGDYKLIYYHNTQQKMLYNLATDIGEKNDISVKNPEKTKELSKILSDYLRNVDAQMPINKKTGKQVPFPDEVKSIN
ncbi:sulfatase [Capnocytophaga cynodegmi]|uniref:Sulfatase n=1 Tax=Capnocytophaga cynodegmi TaxID=28189 RepID=A0A250E7C8_9FLAO|nr:sulfatase [Capnocytophaga cynodegmi]ATA68843.1 sulfatase [Capnocytophaga cynodegmi]